jgi:hypothetical protein
MDNLVDSKELNLADDDPFDSLNNITSDAYKRGYDEGLANGEKAALLQGAHMGVKIALEMTKELGYYFGVCETYLKSNKTDGTQANAEIKACTIATHICDYINRIDMNDSQYEHLFSDLKTVRDKFKQFCSLTNFTSDLQIGIQKNKQKVDLSF